MLSTGSTQEDPSRHNCWLGRKESNQTKSGPSGTRAMHLVVQWSLRGNVGWSVLIVFLNKTLKWRSQSVEKISTSKGDYWIKQWFLIFFNCVPFQNGKKEFKESAPRGSEFSPLRAVPCVMEISFTTLDDLPWMLLFLFTHMRSYANALNSLSRTKLCRQELCLQTMLTQSRLLQEEQYCLINDLLVMWNFGTLPFPCHLQQIRVLKFVPWSKVVWSDLKICSRR